MIASIFPMSAVRPASGLLLGKVDFNNLCINPSGTAYFSLAEAQAAGMPPVPDESGRPWKDELTFSPLMVFWAWKP